MLTCCAVHLAEVMMWVFEEYVKEEDGKWVRPARGAQPPEGKTWVDEGYEPLTEVINRLNENVIYLPGIKLPKSIVATPDIKKCVTGATMMVFVIPHNFLAPIVPKMGGAFSKDGAQRSESEASAGQSSLRPGSALPGGRRGGPKPHTGPPSELPPSWQPSASV